MIRESLAEDFRLLGDIWLRASIKAHHFVPREFWENNLDAMCNEYLPAAETWVVEDGGEIAGFISLMDNTVAALFIAPEKQGQGLGSRLLGKAKERHSTLDLSVYKDNPVAVAFYRRHGFEVVEERQDEHTGCAELVMMWKA